MQIKSLQEGLRPWQHAAVFLLACAIIISRRPDMILRPQFWAEDGEVWFAGAYNHGWWRPLFHTEVGYFQTLPRLAAALALLVPLASAPLICNLVALAVQALSVNLLLSERSRRWGSLSTRTAFAFMYLAIPNCSEICAIITDAQWVLAFAAFLILLMTPAKAGVQRVFDLLVIALCGLSGPFCIFLLPVKAYTAWRRKDQKAWFEIAVLALCSSIQAYGLLIKSPGSRSSAYLGPSLSLFIRILAGDIYLGAIVGPSGLAVIPGTRAFLLLLLLAIVASALIIAVVRRAPLEMKMLAAFASMVLAASLITSSSYDPSGTPQWQLLAQAGAVRYWLYASLLLLWSCVLGLKHKSVAVKSISMLFIFVLCFGIAFRWRRPPFEDTHFDQMAKSFESEPAGTVKDFPENPEGWSFRLIKHGR